MTPRKLPPLARWLDYFIGNSADAGGIPWEAGGALTAEEKNRIGKSIAAFQLGEQSEGRSLLKSAGKFAERFGDERLLKVTRLFIGEEQRHASLLKKFMEINHIELIRENWTDTVFRRLRKNVGYELSVTVLITAEIISLIFYRALKNCTGSKLLEKICDKILADEAAHVRYESEMILFIRGLKKARARRVAGGLHQFLFLGTVMVVYFEHRKVLAGGGYGFIRFWASCRREFSNCFGGGAGAASGTQVAGRVRDQS
ncbi:MAG: hypothetical protein ACRD68_11950 [Pyrinomonadaceae bacterium]